MQKTMATRRGMHQISATLARKSYAISYGKTYQRPKTTNSIKLKSIAESYRKLTLDVRKVNGDTKVQPHLVFYLVPSTHSIRLLVFPIWSMYAAVVCRLIRNYVHASQLPF